MTKTYSFCIKIYNRKSNVPTDEINFEAEHVDDLHIKACVGNGAYGVIEFIGKGYPPFWFYEFNEAQPRVSQGNG